MTEFFLNLNVTQTNTYQSVIFFTALIGMGIWLLLMGWSRLNLGAWLLGWMSFTVILVGAKTFEGILHASVSGYSKTQLENITIRDNGEVFILNKKETKQVGSVTLMTNDNSWSLLGKIDCKDKTWKSCIDEIKANKDSIVMEMKSKAIVSL